VGDFRHLGKSIALTALGVKKGLFYTAERARKSFCRSGVYPAKRLGRSLEHNRSERRTPKALRVAMGGWRQDLEQSEASTADAGTERSAGLSIK
jgi:NAD(P)H-nitrite reductase large subunit